MDNYQPLTSLETEIEIIFLTLFGETALWGFNYMAKRMDFSY